VAPAPVAKTGDGRGNRHLRRCPFEVSVLFKGAFDGETEIQLLLSFLDHFAEDSSNKSQPAPLCSEVADKQFPMRGPAVSQKDSNDTPCYGSLHTDNVRFFTPGRPAAVQFPTIIQLPSRFAAITSAANLSESALFSGVSVSARNCKSLLASMSRVPS
jgi:hypothetical protein